jgi:GNAT superfamily N-acetyltransferase
MTPVIRAAAADLDTLSNLITSAFSDLDPSRWLISDPGERRLILPGYFRILLGHTLAAGLIHATADRAACALWLPAGPGTPPPPADYDTRLAAITGSKADQFRAFDTALEARHPATIPHWHLAILAVRPDRQGQGLGTALLDTQHAVLDRDGIPAYLEASDQRTRRYYQARGYTDHPGPPIQLPHGPQMHPMMRHLVSHKSPPFLPIETVTGTREPCG